MRAVLKSAVIVLPLLAVFFAMRACAGGASGRWQTRIEAVDPGARIVVDSDKLIVIANDVDYGAMVGRQVGLFREALIEEYGDLLGRGREQRMVVVVFSSLKRLQEYAGNDDPLGNPTGRVRNLHGFTRPSQNAIFIPLELTLETMRHEMVHLLMAETHGQSANYSPWLSEGLAQLFEAYDPETTPPTPPGIDQNARRLLAKMTIERIDVRRLLDLQDYSEFTEVDGGRNYIEALVLTGFLFERRPLATLRSYVERERAYAEGRERQFDRLYRYRERAFQNEFAEYLRRVKASGGTR